MSQFPCSFSPPQSYLWIAWGNAHRHTGSAQGRPLLWELCMTPSMQQGTEHVNALWWWMTLAFQEVWCYVWFSLVTEGQKSLKYSNQKLEFLIYCLLPSFLRESLHQEVLHSSLLWDSSPSCRTKGELASLGDLACWLPGDQISNAFF